MRYGELPKVTLDGVEYDGILIKIANPAKAAVLRLPNNAELLDYFNAQKSIRTSIGRRKSKTEPVPNERAAAALFKAIRIDPGTSEFDAFEIGAIVGKLTDYEVTDSARGGEGYRITMQTPFGEVAHEVRVPVQKALATYRRSVLPTVELPHGMAELRFRQEVAGELYDGIVVSVEGYADADPKHVPPHHKSAVATEVASAMDDLDPVLDPLA